MLRIWVCFALMFVDAFSGNAQETSNTESMLTVDRLFAFKEFDAEPVPSIRWSKQSGCYFSLLNLGNGKQEIVRVDLKKNTRTVIASESLLIPKGEAKAIVLDDYSFSADETRVLLFTNSKKVWRQYTRGDYWVLDLQTQDLFQLGGNAPPASLMFAKFSPDASKVAYVRNNNIYVEDLKSHQVTAITTDGSNTKINGTGDWVNEEELSLRDCFRWSPSGRHLLFWQFDTSDVPVFHMVNNVVANTPHITTFAYPKVGEKNSATRIGVVSSLGGEIRWLNLPGDPREHYIPHAEWNPDGNRIFVQQFNRMQTELRVWSVEPATGTAEIVFTEKDSAWLENENPMRWLEGGKALLWVSERSGWRHAYRIPLHDAKAIAVTQGEFDVLSIEAIDEAGGWMYYAASPKNATQRYMYRIRLDGTGTEMVSPSGLPGWHQYSLSKDGQWAMHTYSNFSTPPNVNLVRLPDHTVVEKISENKRLRERIARLKQLKFEFFEVATRDGQKLDAWSITPAALDADTKLPLLVHVYGEPHGQTVKDAWGGSRALWHWMLAQNGYVVTSVDNRGTNTPRGREWRKSVHKQIGVLASRDQAEALQKLLERWPHVDRTRVGIWGWSGGGSMSLNAIFRYPELYRAAVAVAPVANQRLYDTIYQERYMGLPSDNESGFRDGSPITHASKLRGNLLLIHGTGDDNCHYQGTELLIDELIKHGKLFSVLPYPNRSHSVNEGVNTVPHFWHTITQYLNDNLKNAKPLSQTDHELRILCGWEVHISKALLLSQSEATTKALRLLEKQLDQITQIVPKNAVVELQKVPLYIMPEYPGVQPRAEYHPNAGWLKDNNRDPAMAKSVEFTNVRIFEAECNRMPYFVLHELAHAYHDRFLPRGFGNPKIKAAFEVAKTSGKYDKVERHFGNGKPNTFEKSYAMTTPMEYFAESSEAFFGRNDFFPFDREELKQFDSEIFELLKELWR